MDKIFTSLHALIQAAAANPVAALLVCLTVLGLGIAMVFFKHLTYIVEHFPKPAKEKQQLERQILADTLVQDALNELLTETHGDRVGIHQFTNGVRDISGLPFAYSELRFLAMRKGITVAPDQQPGRGSSKMPLSNFNDILKRMWLDGQEPVSTKLDVDDVSQPTLLAMMQENGTETVFACPILNLKKMPVGMMVASYTDRHKLDAHRISDAFVQAKLAEKSANIAGYLLAVAPPRKFFRWPWSS